jgi:hypothetical protein
MVITKPARFKQEMASSYSSKRRVDFHPKIKFAYVPSKESYTPRQKRLLWYGASSILDIEARNTTELVSRSMLTTTASDGDKDDVNECCPRGLLTRKEKRRRDTAALASREVVFRTQETQFVEGYMDEDEIAIQYSKAAYTNRLEARTQGARDENSSRSSSLGRSYWATTTTTDRETISRRRHSMVGGASTSPVRYHPRRRLSALGNL